MKPLHLKQCMDASIFRFCVYTYRSRFITNAKHPANNPPPKIVVPNERYAPAPLPGEAPSSRSRTPPCTISTERVSNAPIANHHLKDLTGVLETEHQDVCAALIGHCSRGSAGCQEDRLLIHSTYQQTPHAAHEGDVIGADTAFNPRWRKMETLPLPLSAVASPGSSASFVVTRNVARAKGPGFVR
jgi:hypothetical protein